MKWSLLLLLLFLPNFLAAQAPKDTLYFNDIWELSSREAATFFRIGTLDSLSDRIFFRGEVKDYYINGDPEMEGSYSQTGEREGRFIFYYPGNIKKAKGIFRSNRPTGNWQFFYPTDKLQHTIFFDGTEENFQIIDYNDSSGVRKCIDGTGDFSLSLEDAFNSNPYTLTGTVSKGKRDDTWKYYNYENGKKEVLYKEVYKNGEFRYGTTRYFYGQSSPYKEPRVRIRFP